MVNSPCVTTGLMMMTTQYLDEEHDMMKTSNHDRLADFVIGSDHHQSMTSSLACCQLFPRQYFHQRPGTASTGSCYSVPAASWWQDQSSPSCNGTLNLTLGLLYGVQCESKKSPLRTCGNFSKTVGNCSTKFHMSITRSYLR